MKSTCVISEATKMQYEDTEISHEKKRKQINIYPDRFLSIQVYLRGV